MHLRFGSHSLGRIRRGQESRYLGRANLHDNFLEMQVNYGRSRTGTRLWISQFPQMV